MSSCATSARRCWARRCNRDREVPALLAKVREHRMAKAALENAVWDAEAQEKALPLWKLLGGTQREIACGVSIGIQDSHEQLLQKIETELAAGYQRIKLKVKPGWDVEVLEKVRARWPDILLSCDANSAYTLDDLEHLKSFDRFKLLMIEQPLWNDDFYFHARLQKPMQTAICLDEAIRSSRDAEAALELGACRIVNIKVGRIGGFTDAIAVHDVAQRFGVPVWCGGMLESGIGRSHNVALSTLPNFKLPGDVSASKRYWKEDIIEPEVEVSPQGTIALPTSRAAATTCARPDRKAHGAQADAESVICLDAAPRHRRAAGRRPRHARGDRGLAQRPSSYQQLVWRHADNHEPAPQSGSRKPA